MNVTHLWLVTEPADMRAGIETLTRKATLAAGAPPQEGHAFLFTGNPDKNGCLGPARRLALRASPPPGHLPLAPCAE